MFYYITYQYQHYDLFCKHRSHHAPTKCLFCCQFLYHSVFKIKQNITMERLMKLMEQRNSVCQNRQRGEAIFDVRAYQRVFQHQLCQTSFEKTYTNPYKRLSFSQYSIKTKKDDFQLTCNHKIPIKNEIKPHEAKIERRVVERIRQKIKNSKLFSQTEAPKSDVNAVKSKISSQSAYIMARKKMFEKHIQLNSSEQQIQIKKKRERQSACRQIEQTQRQLLILKPTSLDSGALFEINLEEDEKKKENNAEPIQKQRNAKYIERVLTKNRRENLSRCQELNIVTSKLKGREATPTLRKGFIGVGKKKSNNSNLIVNSPKRKKKDEDPEQNRFKVYLKNFISQSNLGQEEIQLFPDAFRCQFSKSPLLQKQHFQEISSKAVTILHIKDSLVRTVLAQNQRQKMEIASITKVMTCFLILTITDKFCLDIRKEKVIVSDRASKMQGTSARLAYSDTSTVYEMLHGLMLPSGNDASIVLGEWGGKVIRRYSALLRKMRPPDSPIKSDKSLNFLQTYAIKRKSHVKLFLHHMNKLAKHLQLKHTHFVNTHGLMNEKAYSCSQDMGILCFHAMKNQIFREIVGKKNFQCKLFNRTFSYEKEIEWENTNKLLDVSGFVGVKTGVTPAAGPCLASLFEVTSHEYFIIVVLKTRSCEMRFKQTASLMKTTFQKLIATEAVTVQEYRKSMQTLQKYIKVDVCQTDTEVLNDCKESQTSNSDHQEDEDLDFPNYLQ